MHNEIKTIVKAMLKESVGDDALESFAKQLKIVLNEMSPSGRVDAKIEIARHLYSALKKYYQIFLMNKKTYLTKNNCSDVDKWRKNLRNNILNQLEKSNAATKKKFYWKMSVIEKIITTDMMRDAYNYAIEKIERSLDFKPHKNPPKTTLKKIYELVNRKIPNWK